MAFKRLGNHVSPFTHSVATTLVADQQSRYKTQANEAHLIAKKILADLPLVPTGERVYELTQQLQLGLLDDICPLEQVDEHWQECLDAVEGYLKGIQVWETMTPGEENNEFAIRWH